MLYHLSYIPIQTKIKEKEEETEKKERKENIKNSPTGIRTPVFHVTGEDTNQLYYWRLLRKSKGKEVKVKKKSKEGSSSKVEKVKR